MSKDTDAPKPKRKDTDPPTEEELQQIWEEYRKKGWKKKKKMTPEETLAEGETEIANVMNQAYINSAISVGVSGSGN